MLPRSPTQTTPDADRAPSTALVRGRVLVIDDDEGVLAVVCAIISRRGWLPERAADAESALAAVRARAPDVVLLDQGLPGPDGRSLLRRLREEAPALPVVVMSGRPWLESAADGPEPDGFVPKPFTGDELTGALARALAERDAAR